MIPAQEFNRQRALTWIPLCMLFVFFSAGSLGAETLWDPDFGGYIGDGSALRIGDTLRVLVTPSTRLTLSSSHIDSTEGRLSFNGGSGGGLFDFLPEASSSGRLKVEEDGSYGLEASLTARITRRGENGLYHLEGSRSIRLNAYIEKLSVAGWFSAAQVSPEGTLAFESLHEASLEYSSPGLAMEAILGREDLRESGVGQPPRTGDIASTAADAGTSAAGPALTEEKQRELLLRYFNRFLQNFFKEP
jgi:hypothetical protein